MREAEMFLRANQAFTDAVELIDDRWEIIVPTTPDWTVRDLVNHVAQNNIALTSEGKATVEATEDVLGDDPLAGWTKLAEDAEEYAEDVTEAEKATSVAAQTGDRVLHLWDLQGALEMDQTMDLKLAEFVYDFMLPHADSLAASDAFGPAVAVADNSDVSAKLLALSGRDPHVNG